MENLNTLWWIVILLFVFFSAFVVAMILRNHAAKTDDVGKTEKDSIENSVSIKPRENTKKLD